MKRYQRIKSLVGECAGAICKQDHSTSQRLIDEVFKENLSVRVEEHFDDLFVKALEAVEKLRAEKKQLTFQDLQEISQDWRKEVVLREIGKCHFALRPTVKRLPDGDDVLLHELRFSIHLSRTAKSHLMNRKTYLNYQELLNDIVI